MSRPKQPRGKPRDACHYGDLRAAARREIERGGAEATLVQAAVALP